MPKLTAELILESPQFMNPVRDWELCLRGKINAIMLLLAVENSGAVFLPRSHAV